MPCRPFLAASSSRSISSALKKSLLRSWASVVDAPLFTLRRLVAIAACPVSACIYVVRTGAPPYALGGGCGPVPILFNRAYQAS
jgi:hypothetical protein